MYVWATFHPWSALIPANKNNLHTVPWPSAVLGILPTCHVQSESSILLCRVNWEFFITQPLFFLCWKFCLMRRRWFLFTLCPRIISSTSKWICKLYNLHLMHKDLCGAVLFSPSHSSKMLVICNLNKAQLVSVFTHQLSAHFSFSESDSFNLSSFSTDLEF